jgi:cell division protein FtsI (penicillin-binding protein 3)
MDAEGARPDIEITVSDIIARSSNIGAVLLARSIGPAELDHYFRAFGFGSKSALDLPNEAAGILPPHQKWTLSQKDTVAYGQGVGVTAIQLAAAMNTIANGGLYVEPRLVRSTIDRKGVETMTPASDTHRAIRADTAAAMNTILQRVVQKGGTAGDGEACVPGYTVAGKTGTAYKAQASYPGQTDGYVDAQGRRHYFASFAGFVPAEKPALTILVSIDEPQDTTAGSTHYGATAAAPVFAQIAQEALRVVGVPPTTSASCAATKAG